MNFEYKIYYIIGTGRILGQNLQGYLLKQVVGMLSTTIGQTFLATYYLYSVLLIMY